MQRARRILGGAGSLVALLALAVPTSAPAQQTGAPAPAGVLTPDDLLGIRTLADRVPLALSPDGGMVAYALSDVRKRVSTKEWRRYRYGPTGVPTTTSDGEVWVTDVATGASTNVTGGRGASWSPVWSPDGRWLAFYWDGGGATQLWLWERATGRTRVASTAITRTFFGFDRARWTPDGRSLITKVLPESLTIETAADLIDSPLGAIVQEVRRDSVAVTVYRAGGERERREETRGGPVPWAWTRTLLSDLAVIDVASGRTRRVVRSAAIAGHFLSPDGKQVAYTTVRGKVAATSQQGLHDLHVVDINSGRSRTLSSSVPQYYGISVSWSPDGRWLGYTTAGIGAAYHTSGPRARGDCFVVPAAGGTPRNLTPGEHPYFGDDHRPPAWDAAGKFAYLIGADTLWRVSPLSGGLTAVATVSGRQMRELVGSAGGGRLWSPDGGRSAYVVIRDTVTMNEGIAAVDLRTGETRIVFEEPTYIGPEIIFAVDAAGGRIAWVAQDGAHPTDVWIADAMLRTRRRATTLNPQLEAKALGSSRLISWRRADGRRLRGGLLLPAGFQAGRRYPLLVWVYGGASGSRTVNGFGLNMWPEASMQLFASRGYAVLYPDTPLDVGTPAADIAGAVLPAVDSLIAAGLADSTRVGVMGQSFGGYSTLVLLTRSRRFRAGVSMAGFSDLFGMTSAMQKSGESWAIAWAEEGQGRMGGTPWQYRERYLENSPYFRLDAITAPVLLIHGALDSAVPSFLGDQTFVALRRLGKDVEYVRYEEEEHSPSYWSPATVRDFLTRTLAWFDRHLVPTATSASSP